MSKPILLNLEAALKAVRNRSTFIPHAAGIELALIQAIEALSAPQPTPVPSFTEGDVSNLLSAVSFHRQAYADQASDPSQANIKAHCLRKVAELKALEEKLGKDAL